MISALIAADGDPVGLSRTLASLVPGAVEGILRDVTVVADPSAEGIARVAEHAGCRVVGRAAFRDAVRDAKGEWLLLLPSGAQLSVGWIEAVSEFLAGDLDGKRAPAARFRMAASDRPPLVKRLFVRPHALASGVLVPRQAASGGRTNTASSIEGLAGSVKTQEISAEIRAPRRTASR